MESEKFSSVGEAAGRKAREFAEASREKFEEMKGKTIEELLDESMQWMKKNPGKTLLSGLAVGYLLGSVLRRR